MREEIDIVELATKLHGHLAPGIALGIRMSKIAMEKMNAVRGNRKLVAISETARCLADAMQATTGCTMGHDNALIENNGKLAITLARVDTGKGVRVALKEDVHNHSPLMKKWMMREGKLTHSEEEELGKQLLKLDEGYFDVREIEVNLKRGFDRSAIVKCEECGDLIPEGLSINKDSMILCKQCSGKGYYGFK